jgi:hypothetical protein
MHDIVVNEYITNRILENTFISLELLKMRCFYIAQITGSPTEPIHEELDSRAVNRAENNPRTGNRGSLGSQRPGIRPLPWQSNHTSNQETYALKCFRHCRMQEQESRQGHGTGQPNRQEHESYQRGTHHSFSVLEHERRWP